VISRALSPEQLAQLSDEIRTFLVESVSKTGGHLGPNLGVVELTLAMHRVFDSPRDKILFDTGHQSLRPQDGHRPTRRIRQAPPGRRPVRVSQPRRVPSTT